MRAADFDVARLAARAGEGGTTLTELADTLVREEGLSFKAAHRLVAQTVKRVSGIYAPHTEIADALLSVGFGVHSRQ